MAQELSAVPSTPPLRIALGDFAASWGAFCCSLCLSHPIDTVRIRWVLGQSPRETLRKDSWRSLYAGIGTPVIANGPIVALIFTVNERVKSLLVERRLGNDPSSSVIPSVSELAVAGSLGGFAGSMLLCPASIVRIHQQNHAKGRLPDGSAPLPIGRIAVARRVCLHGGVTGLWRALPAEALAETVGRGAYFATYEWVKRSFVPQAIANGTDFHQGRAPQLSQLEPSLSVKLVAAAASSFVSWGLTYHVDCVKTKLQGDSLDPARRQFRSYGQCCQTIWRTDGWRGFWRGFSLTLVRSVVIAGTMLPMFDFLKPEVRRLVA